VPDVKSFIILVIRTENTVMEQQWTIGKIEGLAGGIE
jgi:hypothetical protein